MTKGSVMLSLVVFAGSMVLMPGLIAGTAMSTAGAAMEDPMALSKLRERAAGYLIQIADSGEPEFRANAMEGLNVLPGRLEPLLRKNLGSQSAGVRAVAAMLVGRLKLAGLADNLRPLVNDPSPFVRINTLYGLSRVGVPTDISPLGGYLMDEDPAVKAQAAMVLGELGNASARPMLMEASGAPVGRADPVKDRLMRLQIAEALVKLDRNSPAIHELRAALYPARPEDLEVCALAVQIVGQLRDGGARLQLRNLTREPYDTSGSMPAEIRMAAAAALVAANENQYVVIAEQYLNNSDSKLRAQAVHVLGETRSRQQLDRLVKFMDDQSTRVKIAAATAILKITEAK
jgi:HEAT repeat protein